MSACDAASHLAMVTMAVLVHSACRPLVLLRAVLEASSSLGDPRSSTELRHL